MYQGVVTLRSDDDVFWLENTIMKQYTAITPDIFLKECVKYSEGVIKYNYTAQQNIFPEMITMAAQINGIPVDLGAMPYLQEYNILYDIEKTMERVYSIRCQ